MRPLLLIAALAAVVLTGSLAVVAAQETPATPPAEDRPGLCPTPPGTPGASPPATPIEVVLGTPGTSPEEIGTPVTLFACPTPVDGTPVIGTPDA